MGFIAQEVQPLVPEAVEGSPEDWTGQQDEFGHPVGAMRMSKEAFIPFLVKAIQELADKNDALVARVAALEGV